MAKITITADTVTGDLLVNIDGNNIANIYDVSAYKRTASPYYDPECDECNNCSGLEASLSILIKG